MSDTPITDQMHQSGNWNEAWDEFAELDPQWSVKFMDMGTLPMRTGVLDLSTVFAGQKVGVKQVSDKIWLVSFMQYDLGYFDHETCRLEPIENPFSPKVLPMSPV